MDTCVVLYTDAGYFPKARRTILDIRTRGEWYQTIVLITPTSFNPPADFLEFYHITLVQFDLIDKAPLLAKLPPTGFTNSDKRELTKLMQWEKFHVFDPYFTKWKRVIFFDAGMRILDSISYLLELDYQNKIIAPNDAGFYDAKDKVFKHQLSFHDAALIGELNKEFPEPASKEWTTPYFLNCMWIYDTALLQQIPKSVLIEYMYRYPLCRTNEMTVMNLVFHYKFGVWKPLDKRNKQGKILFEWCENNHNFPTTWRNFCYMKYPVSIGDI